MIYRLISRQKIKRSCQHVTILSKDPSGTGEYTGEKTFRLF